MYTDGTLQGSNWVRAVGAEKCVSDDALELALIDLWRLLRENVQCMHSVHCSVCPVYTLTDTGIGSGNASKNLSSVTMCHLS